MTLAKITHPSVGIIYMVQRYTFFVTYKSFFSIFINRVIKQPLFKPSHNQYLYRLPNKFIWKQRPTFGYLKSFRLACIIR